LRRVLLVVVTVSLVGAIPAALASSTKPAKIVLYKTHIGKIVVCGSGCPTGRTGYTVYAFTKDTQGKESCQHIQNCLQAWPPVLTTGKPIAGSGIKQSLLGTIKLKSGKFQVTYAHHPIYAYIGDSSKHQTSFVNIYQFGGYWPALNGSGQELDKHGRPTTK
jgi:predicted lipoprotein with Yx(FWY)xxD motif